MDYSLVIRRNRDLLLRITAALLALAGAALVLPRPIFRSVMAALRPAEAAVRRLIFIAASLLDSRLYTPRPAPSGLAAALGGTCKPAFALFDPLKTFDPEIVWNAANPGFESGYDLPQDHGISLTYHPETIDARFLGHRLDALLRALNNLPGQARRLCRWQARRDALLKAGRRTRLTPFRPGLPPGWNKRPRREEEAALSDLHYFANAILNRRDSP